eukprot:15102188-Alexandrium_andersonii.AAC.1
MRPRPAPLFFSLEAPPPRCPRDLAQLLRRAAPLDHAAARRGSVRGDERAAPRRAQVHEGEGHEAPRPRELAPRAGPQRQRPRLPPPLGQEAVDGIEARQQGAPRQEEG